MDFDNWLNEQDWSDIDLVLCVGLGPAAKWPRKIREKTTRPFILVYEPDEKIRKQYSLVERCTVSSNAVILRGRMRKALEDCHGSILLVADDDGPIEMRSAVMDAWNEAEKAAMYREQSAIHTAHLRVAHMLQSLDNFVAHAPINNLLGLFEGKTGVVVGAGPSLDKNIDVLKANRDKVIIAAVNSSWPALDAAGIEPDFVVVCEAKPVGKTISSIPFFFTIACGNGSRKSRCTSLIAIS